MDNLTGKLMELLANKENIENLKNLSNIINANLENSNEKTENNTPSAPQKETLSENIIPTDIIQTVVKLLPIISSINEEDNNTKLLNALRPHLSSKRQEKLDESIKLMQVFKILPVLKSQGIF